ncbi:MAG TPA: ABC transporter permease [Virgibacillus sp.]|nr:ABC transporter permease [Virgibacillus sp.]
MRSLTILELKKKVQDRGLLFWTIILPILFTVLFISVLTSGEEAEMRDAIIVSIVPGYTVMFVFFIIISICSTILQDKNQGMIARLASTPLTRFEYLMGKWFPYMIVVMIQIVILFVFGKLVYNIPFQQPFQLFLLSICLTFCVTGVGIAIAMLIKTENMGIAITQVIALGGAVLSGLWMPIDMMPDFIQTLAHYLPQYWAHQAFQDGMNGTLAAGNLLRTSSILCGFGVAGFLIALIRYPAFLKRAKN